MEGRRERRWKESVLPNYLLRQPLVRSKSRALETVSIRDWVPLDGGTTPALLMFIRAYYSDGHSDRYSLPIAMRRGASPRSRSCSSQPGTVLAFVAAGIRRA